MTADMTVSETVLSDVWEFVTKKAKNAELQS